MDNLSGIAKAVGEHEFAKDILNVFPQLKREGERVVDFVDKVKRASKWNSGLDADTDLQNRLAPDTIDNDKEGE